MRIEGYRSGPASARPDADTPAPRLASQDESDMLAVIGDAVAVRRRFQFFSWTQGRLQSLMPHGVLVCGLPRGNGTGMFFDYFHNVPLPTSALARVCHPRDGIALQLLEGWRSLGSEPLIVGGEGQIRFAGLLRELEMLGMGPTVAHGIPYDLSNVGTHGFFAFISLRSPPGPREALIAAMTVPHMFAAYCRALARDRVPVASASEPVDDTLSEREIEILHWVREGKSNHEIGTVLSISPLTVKNHIQRILRKLPASNRAQAVSKAIELRLLRGGPLASGPPA